MPDQERERVRKEEVHHTKGGAVRRRTMSLREFLEERENIRCVPRPSQPWSDDEVRRRWEGSFESGHRQLALKCTECGLEFVVLTLRSDVEAIETYKPMQGQYGGLCTCLGCPECGTRGKVVWLGARTHYKPIYEFMETIARPDPV